MIKLYPYKNFKKKILRILLYEKLNILCFNNFYIVQTNSTAVSIVNPNMFLGR